jgi:hypothetical protein
MEVILAWLQGKKTSIAAIISAIAAYVSGNMTITQMVAAIFAAIGGMTIRSAVTTEVNKAVLKMGQPK